MVLLVCLCCVDWIFSCCRVFCDFSELLVCYLVDLMILVLALTCWLVC